MLTTHDKAASAAIALQLYDGWRFDASADCMWRRGVRLCGDMGAEDHRACSPCWLRPHQPRCVHGVRSVMPTERRMVPCPHCRSKRGWWHWMIWTPGSCEPHKMYSWSSVEPSRVRRGMAHVVSVCMACGGAVT